MSVDTGTTWPLDTSSAHPRLTALPAFTDNYIWALTGPDGRRCLVVDPGDAQVVERWLADTGRELVAILITHHHLDHIGGLAELHAPGVTVYGPRHEDIPGIDVRLDEGDRVAIAGLGTGFRVLAVPGHTLGHIAFFGTPEAAGSNEPPLLFCGDTLFSAGCGRLFEGTPAQMHDSLGRLAALPATTRVCCSHEYTLSNLRFAAAVEPGNADLALFTRWAEQRRAAKLPTLPGTLARELRINPFLRTREPAVCTAVVRHESLPGTAEEAAVFAALRRWKDSFR